MAYFLLLYYSKNLFGVSVMKKFVSIFMCFILIVVATLGFAGCSGNKTQLKYDVVMITDGGTVDDGSYNESAWNGVKEYAENAGVTYRYFQPTVEENETITVENAQKYIDLAVNSGAEFIVLPTDVFETAVFETASNYPQTKFILVDGMPHPEGESINAVMENVMCVSFDALQSGFLAGYNAVIAGNTNLGYLGSVKSKTSSSYGAGFVQGAAYAADQTGVPVTLDYADYDSALLDFDYSFTVTANYIKVEDAKEACRKVTVVNGKGSGVYTEGSNVKITADPAPEGKVFDRWECVSNTDGIKDKKVNLSTKTKTETNLLIEKCDCTITAVYKDAESTTYPVVVNDVNGDAYSTQYIVTGDSACVKAPIAEDGMKFDHWEVNTSAEGVIDDVNSSETWVHMTDGLTNITLTPVFVVSDKPTVNVTVLTGEGGEGESGGSGCYVTGDTVELSAAVPKDGYIFSSWSNADSNGYGTDISLDNEFYPYTSFEMVNRVQAIAEEMYDKGDSIIFAGGNDEYAVVSEATWQYSFDRYAIGAENFQANWDHYYSTVIKDYGSAVKACLENFVGGYTYTGDCSNNGISMTYVADENTDAYNAVYDALANKTIVPYGVAPGADVRLSYVSNCLTLNYWIVGQD